MLKFTYLTITPRMVRLQRRERLVRMKALVKLARQKPRY